MNRIDRKFRQLKSADKKAFIAFITAGYPSLSVTEKLIKEFDSRGVDIVELGVPFTDPMADGPVIQEASNFALKNKVNLSQILGLVKKVRKQVALPICLMTYYNPVFCFGEERFVQQAVACGVDGVIVPDLPPEEGRALIALSKKHGLDVVCFLSPTSSPERIKFVSRVSRGFIYYVSLTGVTGARKALPPELKNNIRLIKRRSAKPVCVGFGISNRAQVREIQRVADGVIVGSAIVKKIKENIRRPDLVKRAGNFVNSLLK